MKKLLLLLSLAFIGQTKAQYTKILDFANDTLHGIQPWGSLISDGTYLYGMTRYGGVYGEGTVFKILPNGSGYVNLLNFTTGTNGMHPTGSLYYDGTYLYGMTAEGGSNTFGTIFRVMPNGGGYSKLLDFTDGSLPHGSLVSDGTFLYGMTYQGGAFSDGIIFKIMPDGTGYTKLMDLGGGSPNNYGSNPQGSLIYDGTFLYGMTNYGGANQIGTIFKIMPNGTGYVKLLDFAGSPNGGGPYGDLVFDGTFLYGMAMDGGANSDGVIFKIKPDGTSYTKLLDFAGVTNGTNPQGSLILNGSYLYGMTHIGGANNKGTVFKIMPNGSGYVKLLDFAGTSNGSYPVYSSLVSVGTFLYGMTSAGGASSTCISGCGTIFKLAGAVGITETTIDTDVHVFPNPANGTFAIKSNTTDKLNLDLFDVNGRPVLSKFVVGRVDIDVSSIDNGVYTLTIKSSMGITNKKLVIAR